MTIYYLDERLVDKKDIPKDAKFVKRVKREEKWGGVNHKIIELYYKRETTKNGSMSK